MASPSVALRPPHPWPKAGPCAVASSLFCFEGDPHGLSHPFQKAKLLPSFVNFRIDDIGGSVAAEDRQAGLQRHPPHRVRSLVRVRPCMGRYNHLRKTKKGVI